MGKIMVQEQERFHCLNWIGSGYYDYPDGQDFLGKLKFLNKMALYLGTPIGILALNYPPEPVCWRGKTLRFLKVITPFFGVATVFTCVTYISTNIRKKDDQLNYVLGGFSAGSVIGLTTGKPVSGAVCSLILAILAFIKKSAVMNDFTLFPSMVPKTLPSYYMRMFDISLEPDTRRGNWTKEE